MKIGRKGGKERKAGKEQMGSQWRISVINVLYLLLVVKDPKMDKAQTTNMVCLIKLCSDWDMKLHAISSCGSSSRIILED